MTAIVSCSVKLFPTWSSERWQLSQSKQQHLQQAPRSLPLQHCCTNPHARPLTLVYNLIHILPPSGNASGDLSQHQAAM